METVKDLVVTLIASGMTEGEIARAIGCGQPTVHRMKHGADTSYSKGKALECLYLDRLGLPADEKSCHQQIALSLAIRRAGDGSRT